MSSSPKPLWSGRFEGAPDAAMLQFSTSLPFDSRLWRHDIRGSQAHVQMLGARDIIPAAEAEQIRAALDALAAELESGALDFDGAPDEDIHSFVERHLTQKLGPIAGKLHTARSRNDQIALDVRLYLKDALNATIVAVRALQCLLVNQAEAHMGAILPGYTHLQRAQTGVVIASFAGLFPDARARPRTIATMFDARRRVAFGRGGAGGHRFSHRPPNGGE